MHPKSIMLPAKGHFLCMFGVTLAPKTFMSFPSWCEIGWEESYKVCSLWMRARLLLAKFPEIRLACAFLVYRHITVIIISSFTDEVKNYGTIKRDSEGQTCRKKKNCYRLPHDRAGGSEHPRPGIIGKGSNHESSLERNSQWKDPGSLSGTRLTWWGPMAARDPVWDWIWMMTPQRDSSGSLHAWSCNKHGQYQYQFHGGTAPNSQSSGVSSLT